MSKYKFLYLIGLIVLAISSCTSAKASDFSIADGVLAYKGHIIDTAFKINDEKFLSEGGVLANTIPYRESDLEVIKLISEAGHLELWLFNVKSDMKFIKVDSLPSDYKVEWGSRNHIVVSRSSMGVSTTYIYKINPTKKIIKKSKSIINMISFDAQKNYFVRYSPPGLEQENDSVVVGKLFSDYEEVFPIKFDYIYQSDALGMIQRARVEGGNVIVDILQGDNIKTYKYNLTEKKKGKGAAP